ncbi:cysteine--tRNA ligase CPS1 homolog, chloroplastic/mitochondrial-like [Aristolochia californica]|uniref:cysteine--tRNA ligase CPS1 homolog, chloroplastic/mitochondrial-like n=1 Tax=Aristolochia californica TaxID=171875 RepID=UPI0035E2E59C
MGRNLQFQIYNTMMKQKEVFEPRVAGKVGMYICGVTAYDYSHIGHARAYVAFDVLYRYLVYLGYEVTYIRNFTDVDDKIINKANELKEDPLSLSNRFCDEFHIDVADLNCLPPTKEPRVSTHMDQIKDMIAQIIKNDCAYVLDGDVYFSVDHFPEYGRLSGRKLEDNRAGERVAVDSRKRHPADFALWKSAKPGEPSWESPWGPGRPGWHIECSAMSAQHLGPTFDIHGGGQDLIFPHHENELAQSCAACSEAGVKYWVHNGFVNINNEKMSKSLGNFFTIREVSAKYHPLALRMCLMRTHYRSPFNYSIDQVEEASDTLFYIYKTLHDCEEALSPHREENLKDKITSVAQSCINKFQSDFQSAMSDDLHTNVVLPALSEPLKTINTILKSLKGKKQQQALNIQSLVALEKEIKSVLSVLGLMASSSYEVLKELKDKALSRADMTEEEVIQLIGERDLARKNKDYEKPDQIRKRLEEVGIGLMDEAKGTVWKPCVPPKYKQREQEQEPLGKQGEVEPQQQQEQQEQQPNKQ